MNNRIKHHVNALFQNAPNERYALEVKEELLANLNEKYEDLIASGKSEEEAYALVISGIGDIDNLLKDLGSSPEYQPIEVEKNQQKRGVLISIGIALYILSVIPILLFSQTNNPIAGVVLMIIICAAATGIIVYGNNISRTSYNKTDNTFVEEYKEKVVVNNERNKLRGSVTSAMWSLIVVIYFAFSFLTGAWHITWITFLVGALLQQIILYVFSSEKQKNGWQGILWALAVILYFLISFSFRAWGWSWMVFLMAAAIQQIIRMLILWKKAS